MAENIASQGQPQARRIAYSDSGTDASQTSDKSAVVQLLVPQVELQAKETSAIQAIQTMQLLRPSGGPHVNVVLTQVQGVAEVARLLAGVLRVCGFSSKKQKAECGTHRA